MNVTILGTGYVGLTTGATLAFLGHDVQCIDIDGDKIASLRRGVIPFHEPHLAELVAACGDRLTFDTNVGRAVRASEITFITVGTPALPDGRTDLSYVQSASLAIGAALQPGDRHVIVNKSTVPVGSRQYVANRALQGLRDARGEPRAEAAFDVASNPEFLREGSAVHDALYPDRLVLGADRPETLKKLQELYAPLIAQSFEAPAFAPRPAGVERTPVVITDTVSAETIKYASNAFLATKISFINQLAGLCERVGADVNEISHGVGLDPRIGPQFLRAGIGWGGSCFGKDLQALINSGREHAYEMPLLEAAIEVNRRQHFTVIDKLQRELRVLKGKNVVLLGLAFKPDTDDLRDAPALELLHWLLDRGAQVKVHDPVAIPAFRRQYGHLDVTIAEDPYEAAFEADAVVLVTEWDAYRQLDWTAMAATMRGDLVVDGRNVLDKELLAGARLRYHGVGRGGLERSQATVRAPALTAVA